MPTTGATLSWKRTRAATDTTRGVRLFFLELASERPLSVPTAAASITAMDHVVIATADPERAAALYGARLGLDMALDRSHPDWGRLMFFRCGDLIVEVAQRPGKDATTTPTSSGALAGASPISTRRGRGWCGRHRCVRRARRPQARHAGDDRAQRHLRRSHAAGGTDGPDILDRAFDQIVMRARADKIPPCTAAVAFNRTSSVAALIHGSLDL